MTSPITINPSVMITRIAQNEGASLVTQLAKVAQLRMDLNTAQAEKAQSAAPAEQALTNPVNGAEVDLLV